MRADKILIRVARAGGELDGAAGCFYEELTCGDIPKADLLFDVGIETATCDVGHGESGAAKHARLADFVGDGLEALESGVE